MSLEFSVVAWIAEGNWIISSNFWEINDFEIIYYYYSPLTG